MSSQISITYVGQQDRLLLTIQSGGQQAQWWLTRRIALGTLKGWIERLENVNPPVIDAPWMPKSSARNLRQEHALSLEFDALRSETKGLEVPEAALLASTVHLTVTPTETRLQLLGARKAQATFTFTRKESHTMVEALAQKVQQAQWLQAWVLPAWLELDPAESPTKPV